MWISVLFIYGKPKCGPVSHRLGQTSRAATVLITDALLSTSVRGLLSVHIDVCQQICIHASRGWIMVFLISKRDHRRTRAEHYLELSRAVHCLGYKLSSRRRPRSQVLGSLSTFREFCGVLESLETASPFASGICTVPSPCLNSHRGSFSSSSLFRLHSRSSQAIV